MQPKITIELLAPTGDRDDFLIHVVGPGDTDYRFRLSMTRTVLAIWGEDSSSAAAALAETLVYSHGTARAFPEDGFWFDSHNSADTVRETQNKILNLDWRQFVHPAAKESLGASLFNALEELDRAFWRQASQPFLKSLDILFERSQALEDVESEARDNPHFIYRVCILSAVIDRFNFSNPQGSLNGLRSWLTDRLGAEKARELTETFQKVKDLRKQYPIHEHFAVDASGERHRRQEVVAAEQYFGFRATQIEPIENWHKVLTRFTEDVRALTTSIKDLS